MDSVHILYDNQSQLSISLNSSSSSSSSSSSMVVDGVNEPIDGESLLLIKLLDSDSDFVSFRFKFKRFICARSRICCRFSFVCISSFRIPTDKHLSKRHLEQNFLWNGNNPKYYT
ncbi:hypothetical protein BLOT_013970 [Blomia tropicalis]|nr:hypothetical protein BLOT_013970 [Blomia tropicalis]